MRRRQNEKDRYIELEQKYMKLYAEKLDLEHQIKSIEKSLNEERSEREEIKNLHETARRLKHDMKNHLMVLNAYLNDNNYDEGIHYLSEVLNRLNQIYTYIETGNSLMNHILNEKLEGAKDKGIDIKAEIENLSFHNIESMDFSSILNNILDNAVEGSENVLNPLIVIQIRKKRGYSSILVKNKISQSVLSINPQLYSTKKEIGHGFGVEQIKNVSQKYNALYNFYEEDDMFCVCVMFVSE